MAAKIILFAFLVSVAFKPAFSDVTKHDHESTKTVEKTVTDELQAQKTCPVMGGEISKDIFVDYNEIRVYLCCGHCKTVFNKSPEKYLKKLEELGEEPENLIETE